MKHSLAAAAFAAFLIAPAHAALIDFAGEADANGERGVSSGTALTISGVGVSLFSYLAASVNGDADIPSAHNPYLDAGGAGLGVCMQLTASAQCLDPSDDNVTTNEAVGVLFDGARTITSLAFRDTNHNPINAANDGLVRVQTSNGLETLRFTQFMARALDGDSFFANTNGVRFAFVDKQFYVEAIGVEDVTVPAPAAAPLLLSGLAGMAFSRRRKRA